MEKSNVTPLVPKDKNIDESLIIAVMNIKEIVLKAPIWPPIFINK